MLKPRSPVQLKCLFGIKNRRVMPAGHQSPIHSWGATKGSAKLTLISLLLSAEELDHADRRAGQKGVP